MVTEKSVISLRQQLYHITCQQLSDTMGLSVTDLYCKEGEVAYDGVEHRWGNNE